jgi:hypothetical protein
MISKIDSFILSKFINCQICSMLFLMRVNSEKCALYIISKPNFLEAQTIFLCNNIKKLHSFGFKYLIFNFVEFVQNIFSFLADTSVVTFIRACSMKTMDSQCGLFRYQDTLMSGCILTCDYDGCNSAPALAVASTAALLLTAGVALS